MSTTSNPNLDAWRDYCTTEGWTCDLCEGEGSTDETPTCPQCLGVGYLTSWQLPTTAGGWDLFDKSIPSWIHSIRSIL